MTGAGGQCESEIYREERNRDLKGKRRENYNKGEQEFKKKDNVYEKDQIRR